MVGLEAFGQYIQSILPKHIHSVNLSRTNELFVHVRSPASLLPTLHFLRDHRLSSFRQCTEITASDHPSRPHRFHVYYALLSHRYNARLIVQLSVSESMAIPSATGLYASAEWAEREVYDMFGIVFEGHEDLRRILTDYGFEGHPLRKEFPLSGFTEVR